MELTSAGDGRLQAEAPGIRAVLSPAQAKRLVDANHQRITLGFRPEHIHPAGQNRPGAAFSARIRLVEPLGSEKLVYLQVEAQTWVARVDPLAGYRIGDMADFTLAMDQANAFDQETETAIF